MKLSKYTLVTRIDEEYWSLFSTITQALIKLEREKINALKKRPVDLTVFTKKEQEFLFNKHFIVEDNFNDTNFLWVEMSKDRLTPKTLSSYIAMTTECNFACVYCYERGQVENYIKMTEYTLIKTIEWYRNTLIKGNYKKCKIALYGGEPLLLEKELRKFILEMNKVAEDLQIDVQFNIITNGYLMKGEISKFLLDNNLNEIQVTLDGLREIHDSRRMLKNGDGTFDQIISNLKQLVINNVNIVIRVSFDATNIDKILDLLNFLASENLNKRVTIYFAHVHQTTAQQQNGCSYCSQHVYNDFDVIANAYCKLYGEAFRLKFKIPTCYTNGPCMVIGADACLVAPNGDLFKCVEMIGVPHLKVGTVFEANYNDAYYSFMMGKQMDKCIKNGCIYAPICAGGCMMETYVKSGSCDGVICHKPIFEKVTAYLNKIKCQGD